MHCRSSTLQLLRLQELCQGGDWFERLLAGGTYSEVMAAQSVKTMLEAMQYCHSLGVVHRWAARFWISVFEG